MTALILVCLGYVALLFVVAFVADSLDHRALRRSSSPDRAG